jgi:hypothetical protein
MTRRATPYLMAFFLLGTSTCSGLREGIEDDPGKADGGQNMADRCAPGVDSDSDGIANDQECALGTDPFNSDSDKDGVPDGVEWRYPKICVAKDKTKQRRPPQPCNRDTDCATGETCNGLSPTQSDSDGDGVPDGQEDPNTDGMIDIGRGETDPRLPDTDGDGKDDNMGGLDICRPQGLANVNVLGVPTGLIQAGYAPAWGMARGVGGTGGRGVVVMDDAATNSSGAVFTLPSMSADARAESMRVETAITGALGAGVTAVLTGRSLETHEKNPAVTSTYRIARSTSASVLRDSLVMPLTGAAAPVGPVVGTSTEFLMDVTTVRRTLGGRVDVVVGIGPRADAENVKKATSIRINDLVNTTGVSEAGKMVGSACQVFKADKASIADFIWTVDTSGSMSDDQVRLGNTASKFFTRLSSAGVDFRVGIITAGSQVPNLDSPGFQFIAGTDPMGPLRMCQEVTYSTCPMGGADSRAPYPMGGGTEEPTAAGILLHNVLKKRGMMGEMNLNRRFRDGAKVVAFLVTDEPGSNDFSRYFATASDPDTGMKWGATYNAATLANIIAYYKRNNILTFGLVPVSTTPCANAAVADLPRCVIEGNGGAVIKIETALDAEVNAAMDKIVDAVAGATSQFKLDRSPITSTIKVTVRGKEVPRSRDDGFDYDPASRSVVFYGATYRPNKGDQVVVSYRVWEGSLG